MKPAAKYGIAAAVVIVLLAAAGAFWFLRDDAPDEVDLDTAVGSIADNTTTTASIAISAPTITRSYFLNHCDICRSPLDRGAGSPMAGRSTECAASSGAGPG